MNFELRRNSDCPYSDKEGPICTAHHSPGASFLNFNMLASHPFTTSVLASENLQSVPEPSQISTCEHSQNHSQLVRIFFLRGRKLFKKLVPDIPVQFEWDRFQEPRTIRTTPKALLPSHSAKRPAQFKPCTTQKKW